MLTLKEITLSEGGRRVDYHYEATGVAMRYFKDRPSFFIIYDVDMSTCPRSILAIPFVTNVEPIGWLAGFDIHVPELDQAFASSRMASRKAFAHMYPGKIMNFGVNTRRLIQNKKTGDKHLMLFSGGLDAIASLLQHAHERLILVSIHGADIDLNDHEQWNRCLSQIRADQTFKNYPQHTVAANMRLFYSDDVDARLLFGWWGRIQHGHGLLGLLAPLSHILGADLCYIAGGSTTAAWGSTKASDESLRWAETDCVYDAYGMGRQVKAKLVADASRNIGYPIPVRVCYSEVSRVGNCGRCEKCYRTIMNFVVVGADPRQFGLPMHNHTYAQMFELMLGHRSGEGVALCWKEISSELRRLKEQDFRGVFMLSGSSIEREYLGRIATGEIDSALMRNRSYLREELARLKFIARIRLPHLHYFYRFMANIIRKVIR